MTEVLKRLHNQEAIDKKGKFAGKTLLMLGSNVGAADMVQYARQNGAYTITADYLDPDRSEAKRVADDNVLISTADVEALSQLIVERHIDGVLAGISEFNLLKAMELSEKHDLRFYCDMEQWQKIEHKEQFRRLCIENEVPCPKTFFSGRQITERELEEILYPVVLKPVDCSASKGIHFCADEEELLRCYEDALSSSESGAVIIEEFVEGDEFTAHYTICNGKAALSCIDNRYPVAVHEGAVTTIPVARIYPSTYLDGYLDRVDRHMVKLCESLKVKNGVLFVQGICNPESGRFWIFEAGLRSAGENPSCLIRQINGIDYMHGLVDYVLLGESTLDQSKENPYMNGKYCGVISFVARHGVVGKIEGLEETVAATPSVIAFENRYPVGSVTPDTDTLRQLMLRFFMVCDSREQMMRDVSYLNEHIQVSNVEGEDMVIKIDPERILTEFREWGGVIERCPGFFHETVSSRGMEFTAGKFVAA